MRVENLAIIFDALNRAEVRYLVVGGLAVITHGYVRLTNDVDIVLALDDGNVRLALAALERLGYRPNLPVAMEDFAVHSVRERWVREKGMMVFQLFSDRFRAEPIDLFVTEPFPFADAYARAVIREIAPHVILRAVPLAELLAMKREANRAKDRLDIEELLAYQKEENERA